MLAGAGARPDKLVFDGSARRRFDEEKNGRFSNLSLAIEELDYIGGLEMGAVPIASAAAAISALTSSPVHAFFVRKTPKEHGAKLLIEGLTKDESLAGKRVAVIEDVTTTGGSALKAVEAVKDAGAEVALVFTMVDRQEGAAETFAAAGIRFEALFKAEEFLRG